MNSPPTPPPFGPPQPPPPPPPVFGDPTQVQSENRAAVKKGVLFGCGGCGLFIAVILGFVACILLIVFTSMKSTDAYAEAVTRAKASVRVKTELGEPLETGWFTSGSVNVNGAGGHANLNIPLSGPKGSGTLHLEADKRSGQWHFRVLTVTVDGSGKEIDLLNTGPTAMVLALEQSSQRV